MSTFTRLTSKSLPIFCFYCSKELTHALREKCPNTGKYGPEKTLYLNTFHAVMINPIVPNVPFDLPENIRRTKIFLIKREQWKEKG